jgi:hypothetical protein
MPRALGAAAARASRRVWTVVPRVAATATAMVREMARVTTRPLLVQVHLLMEEQLLLTAQLRRQHHAPPQPL